VGRRLSVHKEHELLLKLERAGLGDEEAQKVIGFPGNELAEELPYFINHYEATRGTSPEVAGEIMGQNFISYRKARQLLGYEFSWPDKSEELFFDYYRIPFSCKTLHQRRNTHLLFPGFNWTIGNMSQDQRFQDWFNDVDLDQFYQLRTERTLQSTWYLMEKAPQKESFNRSYDRSYCSTGRVPSVAEILHMTILYRLCWHESVWKQDCWKGMEIWSSDVLDNPGSYCAVIEFGESGGFNFKYYCEKLKSPKRGFITRVTPLFQNYL